MAPYAVGIVQLDCGVRLPGMIRGVKSEEIQVGMPLIVDFEPALAPSSQRRGSYYFRPAT